MQSWDRQYVYEGINNGEMAIKGPGCNWRSRVICIMIVVCVRCVWECLLCVACAYKCESVNDTVWTVLYWMAGVLSESVLVRGVLCVWEEQAEYSANWKRETTIVIDWENIKVNHVSVAGF